MISRKQSEIANTVFTRPNMPTPGSRNGSASPSEVRSSCATGSSCAAAITAWRRRTRGLASAMRVSVHREPPPRPSVPRFARGALERRVRAFGPRALGARGHGSIASADSALDWEIRAVLGLIAEPRALR